MLIRDVAPTDIDALVAINEAEVPAVGSVTREAMHRLVEQSVMALAAEIDGHVAGFCLVIPPGEDYASSNYQWFSERYDDFVYLDRVAISPTFQRRGIGRALYNEVERLAAEVRPTATDFLLEVNTRPRNETSLAFHNQLGFEIVTERDTPYGVRVAMMSKSL